MKKTLITGGTLVTENDTFKADIAITGSKITGIGHFNPVDFDAVYEVPGCYVMPGLIDAHTHLELQQLAAVRPPLSTISLSVPPDVICIIP